MTQQVMKAGVLERVRSSSRPGVVYEIRQSMRNGSIYCTCPSWIYQHAAANDRKPCKHIRAMLARVLKAA